MRRDGTRKSILVMVDDFSKYVILVILDRLDSNTVKEAFIRHVLSAYGRPLRVRTDRGSEF